MATLPVQLNTWNRGGVTFQTLTSDLFRAVIIPTKAGAAYSVTFKALAFRVQNYAQMGSYWKKADFRTDPTTGVVTQVSTTQSVVADVEDAAGWQCLINPDTGVDNTQIVISVAADGTPTNWMVDAEVREVELENIPIT